MCAVQLDKCASVASFTAGTSLTFFKHDTTSAAVPAQILANTGTTTVLTRTGTFRNFLWANDLPHHEGTWPHSAAAIERTMAKLSDAERARVLGLNAARIFKFDIPARYRGFADVAAVA